MRSLFHKLRPVVPVALASFALVALPTHCPAQFYKLHGGTLSVGGTGNFEKTLTANPTPGSYTVPQAGGGSLTTTVSNQQQFTTLGAGFITSLQFHPVSWAGIELNYGFQHYQERFAFNYATTAARQTANVAVDTHELTAAYQFHPRFIPFQPFVNVGGGAIDFAPNIPANQWRGAGLLEVGFDIPTKDKHVGFRIEGRSLYYRAPNFNTPAISTRSWRVTAQPSASVYYRF